MKALNLLLLIVVVSCSTRKGLHEGNQVKLNKVFIVNEKLFESYFEYSPENIKISKLELIRTINNLDESLYKAKLLKATEYLEQVSAKNKRELNNDLYNSFSKILAKVLHKYQVSSDYNIYKCNMVNKIWVQNSSKLEGPHNPYAPWMPYCGSQLTKFK